MPRALGALILTLGISLLLALGLADGTGSHGGRSYKARELPRDGDSRVRATVNLVKDSGLRPALKR